MDKQKTEKNTTIKWHLRPVSVIVALLALGPFGLPFLWISPAFTKNLKILLTILMAVVTIWLVKASGDLYSILLEETRELQKVLSM